MIEAIREWYGVILPIICTVGGGGVVWFINQRTQWFKSNTVKAEEEAKQEKARSQAFAAATIEAIKAGDASAYGTMLKWMEGQLVEQSAQHGVQREQLLGELQTLRERADRADRRISALIEDVAECGAREASVRREFGELRINFTQYQLTRDGQAAVASRQNADLITHNRKLVVENLHLRGLVDLTATDVLGPAPEPYGPRNDS